MSITSKRPRNLLRPTAIAEIGSAWFPASIIVGHRRYLRYRGMSNLGKEAGGLRGKRPLGHRLYTKQDALKILSKLRSRGYIGLAKYVNKSPNPDYVYPIPRSRSSIVIYYRAREK